MISALLHALIVYCIITTYKIPDRLLIMVDLPFLNEIGKIMFKKKMLLRRFNYVPTKFKVNI